MDTAVRDLEQIEERDPTENEATFRRAAAFVMAALVTLALVYGMAAILAEPTHASDVAHDPLAALSHSEALAAEASAAADEERAPLEVDRTELTFPTALVGDDRPEVAATLAAAVAEHEALGTAPAMPVAMPPMPQQMHSPIPSPAITLPAAVAAVGGAQPLAQAARVDPLLAASLPEPTPTERGSVGSEGAFTLQVVSYRTEEEADLFADALRAKGHDSFVEEAEVEGRGRFFRVRIGPFDTRGAATRYRRTFEQSEQMDTYVVRRRDPDED